MEYEILDEPQGLAAEDLSIAAEHNQPGENEDDRTMMPHRRLPTEQSVILPFNG